MNFFGRMLLSVLVLAGTTHFAIGQNPDDKTKSFWQAARDGDVEKIKRLVDDGVDVNAVTEFKCGAVYFAANRNQGKVIRALVDAGADVNLRDTDYGFTPVQMAAWLGHTEATEVLIDSGASKNDVVGSCFAAASNGHAETVKLIVDKLKLPAAQLNALWNTARGSGHDNVCQILVELGAKPPEPKKDDAKSNSATSDDTKDKAAEPEKPAYDFESDKPLPVDRAKDWPAFRGENRNGLADGQHPPAAFDLDSGRNVRWQLDVEGLGLSSPVICNGQIFITTAVSSVTRQAVDDNGLGWIASVPEETPHQWKVVCYDLKTGKLVWEQASCQGIPKSRRHWKASQANPTCATDGKHLLACFGSEGLYCYDLQGKLKWKKDLGDLDSGWYIDSTFPWGFASSPVIYRDAVIIQCDVFRDPFIAAFHLDDGKELWRKPRESELPSWGTPLVVRGPDRDELVTNASKAVRGYDPRTGELLWQIKGNSTITVSSPVAADGLIVATGGYKTPKPIYVVRAGQANGDATPAEDADSSSVAWSRQNGGIYILTPLMYRGLLYLCKQNGVLSVYDAQTGEQKYRQRLNTGPITASPVAADGKIFFVGEDGRVVVITAGDSFEEISLSQLNESSLATPAISDGTIVFRTVKGLIAVAHDTVKP